VRPRFRARAKRSPRQGYRVTVAYKGVELIRAYSDPKAGRHSLQIEINKRLYMDERTLQKNAGFSTIQKNLGELLRVLIDEISD
jgi:N-formylglutamate amidohydrolase